MRGGDTIGIPKKLVFWVGVAGAAIAAAMQSFNEQKRDEHIEDMERRISELENKEEEAE